MLKCIKSCLGGHFSTNHLCRSATHLYLSLTTFSTSSLRTKPKLAPLPWPSNLPALSTVRRNCIYEIYKLFSWKFFFQISKLPTFTVVPVCQGQVNILLLHRGTAPIHRLENPALWTLHKICSSWYWVTSITDPWVTWQLARQVGVLSLQWLVKLGHCWVLDGLLCSCLLMIALLQLYSVRALHPFLAYTPARA